MSITALDELCFDLDEEFKQRKMQEIRLMRKNPAEVLENLIKNPVLLRMKNLQMKNFQCGKSSLQFDLTILKGQTQHVEIDFEPDEVVALAHIVKQKVLNCEREIAWCDTPTIDPWVEERIPDWKKNIQTFLKRNEKKPHVKFCFHHLKEMLLARSYNSDIYLERQGGKKLSYFMDHSFSLIEMLLLCATPAFDETENSPHLMLLTNNLDGMQASLMRPIFKAFGADYLAEVIQTNKEKRETKPYCGLDLILREFNIGKNFFTQALDDSLVRELAQPWEYFKDDATRPEVMASLLNHALKVFSSQVHDICLNCDCYSRKWRKTIVRCLNYLTYILQKIPRRRLKDVLPLAKINICKTYRVKCVPNNIHKILGKVLGIKTTDNSKKCCEFHFTRNHVQEAKPPFNSYSLGNIAEQNSQQYFQKFQGEEGFNIEKIVLFKYLPKKVKMSLLWAEPHYNQVMEWKGETRSHFCDFSGSREDALKIHEETKRDIALFFLEELVYKLDSKNLLKEHFKIRKFMREMTKKYNCKANFNDSDSD